ncbi:MAG TPA: TVP38/TMEM64 family protein [Acidobacteriota bacterium]|nr:TVP38/TMEM64 family protein [Acidobacteriota bacterium]
MSADAKKRSKSALAVRVGLAAVVLGLLVYASVRLGPAATRLLGRPEDFRNFINSYGAASALVYMLVQTLQVVVAVIPGEIAQVAGGYAFGTFLGTLYSLIGIAAGTLVAFFLARLVGFGVVRALAPAKSLEKFEFIMNSPRFEVAMFVLFLVPGIPKDTLVYIAGLTPVTPWKFLVISLAARFPGIWGSAYIGAHLQQKEYLPVWIMSGLALVLFVVGLLTREKIIAALHRLRRHTDKGGPEA